MAANGYVPAPQVAGVPEDSGNETGRVLLWIGLGVLAVLLLFTPFGWMWGGDWWDWFGGFIWMMMLFPVILIVLIVVLIVAIANGSRRQAQPPAPAFIPVPQRNALEILERRYANGEVTRAEYLRMRGDLSGKS